MSQMAGLLERDRIRFGFTVGQAAYRLGLTVAQTAMHRAHSVH